MQHSEPFNPMEVLSGYPPHDHTLYGLLQSRAQRGPDRPFLLFQGRTCTYGKAVEHVDALADGLATRGIAKGDRVAIMSTNSDAFVLLMLGLAKMGAVVVPVNPELNASEAGYILDHAGASAIACTGLTLKTARAVNGKLPPHTLALSVTGQRHRQILAATRGGRHVVEPERAVTSRPARAS